ncbi:MAG: N-acetylmuramoyl-L-alanine amidase, partial [Candidatus Hydrogenedentota bacterium]
MISCICVGILLAGCARRPYVTPRAALDYGQFTLRQLPPEVELEALRGKRIVIDPGHGGVFAGAVGPNNLREADVNLGVGLYLWGMLTQAGAEASLTRVSDSNVYQGDDLNLRNDLQARAEYARARQADLFLSLHHNADVLPGAKKNSLETYFKMSDPGPSLDAARSIHRQLALSLGQADNVILPGNFRVLRESPTTAILGEPSYISHADNAFRLGLAPMQRLEAQAYFLGIAEYFSKGVPEIKDVKPTGTIRDDSRPLIAARVIADRNVAIEPDSVTMLIDGRPVEAEFDQETSQLMHLPTRRLSNGKHTIWMSLRNVNGNAARPAESEIEITMPPAYLLLSSNFRTLPPSSMQPIRLSARVFDADLMPVADGTPVGFNASSGTVSPNVALTRNGEAVTYITPEKDSTSREITTSANTSGLTHSLTLSLTEDAPQIIVTNVLDAKTKLPVERALVSAGDRPLGYSDRTGYFAVTHAEISDSPIAFSRPGYATQELSLS